MLYAIYNLNLIYARLRFPYSTVHNNHHEQIFDPTVGPCFDRVNDDHGQYFHYLERFVATFNGLTSCPKPLVSSPLERAQNHLSHVHLSKLHISILNSVTYLEMI